MKKKRKSLKKKQIDQLLTKARALFHQS